MSLVVTKGYLIARYDYNIFDEILVFLNEHGVRFTCIALGTRKIVSKNAKALLYGNYLEIELFYTHNDNKLSKLKKVVAINQIGFDYASNLALITISDVIAKLPEVNKNWFFFYQEVLVKVLMDYEKYKLSCYVFLYTIKYLFKHFDIKKCKHLEETAAIDVSFSFKEGNFVCCECHPSYIKLTTEELILINSLNNNQTNLTTNFFNNSYNINWKNLYTKLELSYLKYVKEINKQYKK